MDRRSLLGRLGVILVAGGAGCTSDGDGTTPGTTATAMPTADTATGTASPTDQQTETATESGTQEQTTTDTPGEESTETATDTQTETETATPTSTTPDYTVVVGPNGTFQFDPDQLTIAAGETVEWVWDSNNHNVRPDDIPDGAEWSGTPGGDGDTYDEGYVYQYTFTVTGDYSYHCEPHENLGMTGSLTVQ